MFCLPNVLLDLEAFVIINFSRMFPVFYPPMIYCICEVRKVYNWIGTYLVVFKFILFDFCKDDPLGPFWANPCGPCSRPIQWVHLSLCLLTSRISLPLYMSCPIPMSINLLGSCSPSSPSINPCNTSSLIMDEGVN